MNYNKMVSVVIANYNMGQYLASAINSVLEQTYRNLEIIVVDDGSNDNTRSVMRQFENDIRVTCIYQDNQGQAVAKNREILEAKGEIIAFLDADDLWLKDKIEKQITCFDISKSIGVVYTDVAFINKDGSEISNHHPKTFYSGKISRELLIDNFITGMASFVKRECFNKIGLFDESLPMGIDWDLWLRISAHYDFHFLDEVTYLYRKWEGQMSHKYRKRYECAILIMNKFIKDYPGLIDKKTIKEAWAHTYVGRATHIANGEGLCKDVFVDLFQALKYKTTYLPAWKALIKICLNRLK